MIDRHPAPWRPGESSWRMKRTIYDAENCYIGIMQSAELTDRVVAAVNRPAAGAIGVHIEALVVAQRQDEGLWFKPHTQREVYIQQALARLHQALLDQAR